MLYTDMGHTVPYLLQKLWQSSIIQLAQGMDAWSYLMAKGKCKSEV